MTDNKVRVEYSDATNKVSLTFASDIDGKIPMVLAGFSMHECIAQSIVVTIEKKVEQPQPEPKPDKPEPKPKPVQPVKCDCQNP